MRQLNLKNSKLNTQQQQRIGALFAFLIGLGSLFEFNLIGKLNLQEAALGVAAPFLLLSGWQTLSRLLKWILFAVSCWLFIQVLTDLVRGIPFNDMARGGARILVFGAAIATLGVWLKNDRFKIGFLFLGMGLSSALSYFMYPTQEGFDDPWKWNFAGAVVNTFLALLVLNHKIDRGIVWVLLLLAVGVASTLLNFRSHAALLLLIACYIVVNNWYIRLPIFIKVSSAIGVGLLTLGIYSWAASSGVIGQAAQQKFEMQSKDDLGIFSVLARGRTEYKASLQAIKDSPLLGYGSWAQHPEYVYLLWDADYGEFTAAQYANQLALGIIPTHSYITGAWVDGGPLPALFWIMIWGLAFYALISIDTSKGWLPKLAAYLAIGLLWNILFSPFGTGARTIAALSIVIIISASPYWLPIKTAQKMQLAKKTII